jgi:hypothetical protein
MINAALSILVPVSIINKINCTMSHYNDQQNNNPKSDPSLPRKTMLQLGAIGN